MSVSEKFWGRLSRLGARRAAGVVLSAAGALLLTSSAGAAVTLTLGAGSAVVTADRTASFDSLDNASIA